MEISKPVTPLRSLVSPANPRPPSPRGRPALTLPSSAAVRCSPFPTRAACPTAPLRSRLLKSPSELKTLGLPPPQTRAPKGGTLWNRYFHPPPRAETGPDCHPPCRTPPGQSVPNTALPGNHAGWVFRPPQLHRRFSPITPKAPFRSGKRDPQPAFGNPARGLLGCQLGFAQNARSHFRLCFCRSPPPRRAAMLKSIETRFRACLPGPSPH